MRRIFLLIFCMSLTFLVQAQVVKTVNVTAGGLSTVLTATEKSTITNLTVTGTIDARDFKTMRDSIYLLATLDISKVNIIAYTGSLGPEREENKFYPKDFIPGYSFDDCNNFTKIIMPLKIDSIGESAFSGSRLSTIAIPEGVKSIPYFAFYDCHELTSVTIPSSVTYIGECSFDACSSLNLITIPSSVTTIEDQAFHNCTSLNSVTIPSSVSFLGDEIFSGCDSLATVIISEGVTTIGRWMFDYCSGLTSVSLPNSLNTIRTGAFGGCTGLTSIIIPSSVSSIYYGAFNSCTGLKSIVLPPSITTLGDDSFAGCYGLTSVDLSEGVISIGAGAFNGCTGLTSVTIPSTVSSIGEKAFNNCTSISSVFLKEGVGSIGFMSFANCNSITKVVIPSSVSLGSNTFDNCKAITSVVFSDGVDSIGFETFMNCSNLSSVTIPSSVSYYGYKTFSGCKVLKAINSYSITPVKIEKNYAFEDVNKNTCALNIPIGSKSAYQVAAKWKEFTNIVEMPSFTLSSTTVNLAAMMNSKDSVNITTSTSWSASSNQTWLTVSPPSGVGNGKLVFNATENSTNISRTAEVTLTPKDAAPQTITVTQAKGTVVASLLISSNWVSINKDANSIATVEVNSNISWSASSDQTWLTTSPLSGTGNGKLTFTVEKNPTNITRSAIVTVSSKEADSQIITITQEAGSANLLVSSNAVSLAKETGSIVTIDVTSNTTWNAISDQIWLTVNPASGTGNGILTLTATANASATTRIATVTVSISESTSQTITITQEAGSGTWVNAISDDKIKLYPNPTNDRLYIEGITVNTLLILSDLNGRICLSKEVDGNENIYVGSLPHGIYILRLTTKNGIKETKLVKK